MRDVICALSKSLLFLILSQCSYSWPLSYRYIMADYDRCHRESPDVVMWVQGRSANPTHRAIIRELLSNNKAWPKHIRVLTFFMVGTTNNTNLQYRLQYEFEAFGDIVQNDYTEHYKNQTAKMVSAINFLSDYCQNAKLAIRMDDDVIFHPTTMINKVINLMTKNSSNTYDIAEDYHQHSRFVESLENKANSPSWNDTGQDDFNLYTNSSDDTNTTARVLPKSNLKLTNENTILCHILAKRTIIRPDMKRSYPVDYSVLPNEKVYPDFCAGFFFAMSVDLLPKFQSVFADEPPFWIDDSYLGVLQRRLKTVNVAANKMLFFDVPKTPSLRALISGGTDMETIAVHLNQGVDYYKRLARSNALDELRSFS